MEYEQYLKNNPCKGNCPAHNGTDCTRDPYEEGCLDPVVEEHWAKDEKGGDFDENF